MTAEYTETGPVVKPIDMVLTQIQVERMRQERMWGFEHDKQHTDAEWLAIAMKQLGCVAQAGLNGDTNVYQFEKELTQCAAVMVAWLEMKTVSRFATAAAASVSPRHGAS